ncbi:MAG TPA: glycoside hydrolase family 15 protein [Gaiellaceae bacterium]|nr:glycoside hydrolase family 15 protein [Gaiellaceae bacterium]
MRIDGFAAIQDYAAIGDGEAVALVALDGSIDWLCLPCFDSDPVFAALLDPERGGSFALCPDEPFEAERRYLPETNVLETTCSCSNGTVRITDAMALNNGAVLPWRELTRRVEGLSGSVPVRYGMTTAPGWKSDLELLTWGAGEDGATEGRFRLEAGSTAQLTLVSSPGGPCPRPTREEAGERLDETAEAWRRWVGAHTYDHEWKEAVVRSLLALKLLISSSTGSIVAAPTTSLPERIGGERNWDYRYAWVRDSCWTIGALIGLGFREQAHESLGWLLRAIRGTQPDVDPIYELDGSVLRRCEELDWPGYRSSRPVVVGNRAGDQLQLGGFADVLDTAWAYVSEGNRLDSETSELLAGIADHVCGIWERQDAGIWELLERRHYTQSKVASWTALQRACDLARGGHIPDRVAAWQEAIAAVEDYVEEECWSDERQSYVQYPRTAKIDAAELLCSRRGYGDVNRERVAATVDTIRAELGRGPLLYRYSGQEDEEGAFVACSFWLAEAFARLGRVDEAAEQMESTLAFANDVGLYSEEIDPETGDFLGNFPQGLSHLSLIRAALAVEEALG